jgi:hypothetical protein
MNRHRDSFQGVRCRKSHPVEVEAARMYGFWKSKRRGDGKKRKWFRNNYCQNQGACVIAIIWLGQKEGHEQDGLKG